MIPLTVLSLLLGAVLGLRFKALALVPAMVLLLISTAAAALAQGADLWRPSGAIALAFIALQAGFFAGAFARPRLAPRATRAARTTDGRMDSRSVPLRTSIE
jgi:hypothetical protein